jgi:hypothetical protein
MIEMQPKHSFYFVLYLVVVVDLLAVVTERDYWMDSTVRVFETPVRLSVPRHNQWVASQQDSLPILISGAQNGQEKGDVRYVVQNLNGSENGGTFTEQPVVNAATGNGTFIGTFNEPGEYRFAVWATLPRTYPKEKRATTILSDTVNFSVIVQKDPVPAAQFTMAVDKKHDNWITGIRYEKQVFVNADPWKLRLLGLPRGFRRGEIGNNSVQLIWDNPVRGKTTVSLHGYADRGLDRAIDSDDLSFSIDVAAPGWNPEPGKSAYWKVPYTFSSAVGGLDPGEYVVRILANGTVPVATISAKQYPFKILPEQSWNSITFEASSAKGAVIMKKEVAVQAPPPPQIEWNASGLKGTDYVIEFSCRDITESDVDVRYEVLYPQGLTSRLDPAAHGKSFTLKIRDITKNHPQFVTVRVSAQGISQVPSRPLDKTFVPLY